MKRALRINTNEGFTLIELMIVIAIIGIIMGYYVKSQTQLQRSVESEISLQIAIRALQNQTEILRAIPVKKLDQSAIAAFDPKVEELRKLVAGRGVVRIQNDPQFPNLLLLRVEVHWRDARMGMRSIHTILMRHL